MKSGQSSSQEKPDENTKMVTSRQAWTGIKADERIVFQVMTKEQKNYVEQIFSSWKSKIEIRKLIGDLFANLCGISNLIQQSGAGAEDDEIAAEIQAAIVHVMGEFNASVEAAYSAYGTELSLCKGCPSELTKLFYAAAEKRKFPKGPTNGKKHSKEDIDVINAEAKKLLFVAAAKYMAPFCSTEHEHDHNCDSDFGSIPNSNYKLAVCPDDCFCGDSEKDENIHAHVKQCVLRKYASRKGIEDFIRFFSRHPDDIAYVKNEFPDDFKFLLINDSKKETRTFTDAFKNYPGDGKYICPGFCGESFDTMYEWMQHLGCDMDKLMLGDDGGKKTGRLFPNIQKKPDSYEILKSSMEESPLLMSFPCIDKINVNNTEEGQRILLDRKKQLFMSFKSLTGSIHNYYNIAFRVAIVAEMQTFFKEKESDDSAISNELRIIMTNWFKRFMKGFGFHREPEKLNLIMPPQDRTATFWQTEVDISVDEDEE